MSTASFAESRSGPFAGAGVGARDTPARAPALLAFALIVAIVYAAFAHGAIKAPAEPRLQVALALVAALAGGAWLWTGTLRLAAPRLAIAGIGLLGAFAVWSAITLIWSVSPDATWIELNRILTYVLVLCLAVPLGASYARALARIATGFWLVALVVTGYGLGQKLFPGIHVGALVNFNQTGQLPRLQEPFGYWNALALFITMGVPPALALAVDQSGSRRVRLGGVVSLELMFLAIGSTYSRGGLLALLIAAVAAVALSGVWLRALLWLAAPVIAVIPPLIYALTSHPLTTAGVGLGRREGAGALLAAILVASLVLLILAARRLLELEQAIFVGPDAVRRISRRLLALAGVVLVAVVLAVGFSSRGFGGTASHAWRTFTATRATSNYDASRLLSANSENRWTWWKEAAGAIRDRPVAGWGAGSFPVVHLLYRRDTLSVRQPHSMPLQWLVETGVVGTVLAIGGLGLLLAVAVGGTRRTPQGSERLLMAALSAAALAYAVHSLYDWDWDIPGVTLPPLVFLGVIAGRLGSRRPRQEDPIGGPGRTVRAVGVAALTLLLCCFALSAALPNLAASKARSALVSAGSGALDRAHTTARVASTLDPLSDAGLKAEATVAVRRRQLRLARSYLLDAISRNPSDPDAWSQVAYLEWLFGDVSDARRAARRALALDPRGQSSTKLAVDILQRINVLDAPPPDSATATPLPQPLPRPRQRSTARAPAAPRP